MQEQGSYICIKNRFKDDFYYRNCIENKFFNIEGHLFGLKFYMFYSILSDYCYFNKSNLDKKHVKFIVKNIDKFLTVNNDYIIGDYLAIHYNDLIDLVKNYSLEEWFA